MGSGSSLGLAGAAKGQVFDWASVSSLRRPNFPRIKDKVRAGVNRGTGRGTP